MKIIVTGCAGFIGSHVSEYLLKRGDTVIGIDNMNDYYDTSIKYNNLNVLHNYDQFFFYRVDVNETSIFYEHDYDIVCHLASRAGVRYSIEHPKCYVDDNIKSMVHILDCIKKKIDDNTQNSLLNLQDKKTVKIPQLVYASSSSVYGNCKNGQFNEEDRLDNIVSPYALSKKVMEEYARLYYNLFKINSIGLRFFTVYGPRGRVDMAPYKFLNAIHNGDQFEKYGAGFSARDYTYIDDIVSGVIGSIDRVGVFINCEVYNLGNNSPITLNDYISLCEKVVGKKANYKTVGRKMGDVFYTCANIEKACIDIGYNPQTSLEDGMKKTYEYIKTL